jgi:hypothetical protein
MTRFSNRTINRIKRNFSRSCSTAYIVRAEDFGRGKRIFYKNLHKLEEIYKNSEPFDDSEKIKKIKEYFRFLRMASGGTIDPFKDVLDDIGDVDYAEYDDESWK